MKFTMHRILIFLHNAVPQPFMAVSSPVREIIVKLYIILHNNVSRTLTNWNECSSDREARAKV